MDHRKNPRKNPPMSDIEEKIKYMDMCSGIYGRLMDLMLAFFVAAFILALAIVVVRVKDVHVGADVLEDGNNVEYHITLGYSR